MTIPIFKNISFGKYTASVCTVCRSVISQQPVLLRTFSTVFNKMAGNEKMECVPADRRSSFNNMVGVGVSVGTS